MSNSITHPQDQHKIALSLRLTYKITYWYFSKNQIVSSFHMVYIQQYIEAPPRSIILFCPGHILVILYELYSTVRGSQIQLNVIINSSQPRMLIFFLPNWSPTIIWTNIKCESFTSVFASVFAMSAIWDEGEFKTRVKNFLICIQYCYYV